MGKNIRVRAIRKEEPDIGLYVLALIALARQLQEEGKATPTQPTSGETPAGGEASHD
jgi:hypothetical protein